MDRVEEMLKYVESYYRNSRFYIAQNNAKGQEFNMIHAVIEDLPNQFNPQTATWALRLWEELYNLESVGSIAERRMQILSKMSVLQNVTPISLERLIKRLYHVSVSIIRNIEPYRFKLEIDYGDKGMDLADLRAVRKLIEEYKEAHMAYGLLGNCNIEFQIRILQECFLKIVGDIPVQLHEYPLALSINAEIKKQIGFSFEKLDLLSAVLASSHYENEMGFSFDFYPRANQSYLFLDGTWELDGTDTLDGYEGEELMEFYPLQMQIQGEFKQVFATEISRLLIQMDCRVAEEYNAQMEIASSVLFEENLESRMTVQGTVQQEMEVEGDLVIEKDLWFLDGSECLDGSRIMDAAVFHHDL